MANLPTGTVTFLFTDIEGSTRLWEQHPDAMRAALARHDTLASAIIAQHAGTVVKSRGEGDSLFAVFADATQALAAACALQRALVAEPWPPETPLRVRMALHTGEADLRAGDYYGPAVNRCARLRAAGHGAQVLLSAAAADRVRGHLPSGIELRDLGERRLKDLIAPERIFQLLHPDLPGEFPPLLTLDARPNNLPAQPNPLLGREQEAAAASALLRTDGVRLVTLIGPGGTGKTRLGLQVAADLIDDFENGVFLVDLAPITDPNLVLSTIAQALGVRETGGTPLEDSLKAFLSEKQLLLLLDNFEQVLEAAPVVAGLLAAAPRLKVLVTSRAVLNLRGEHEFPVPPLGLPDPQNLPPVEAVLQYPAVALFAQRAAAVRSGFAVTDENAAAIAEICCRLDGLPLAIELAAARAKLFAPPALLSRLDSRLQLLTGGARDLPVRQRTLRDTIAWSYDLLDATEQRLFRRLSVFVGGFTLEAAEAVCNAESALGMDVLGGIASLVDKSLLRQVWGGEPAEATLTDGEPRFGMLETIREYAREQLAESGEAEAFQRLHAACFLSLAETDENSLAFEALKRRMDQLELEHDNLRAALDWLVESDLGEWGLRLGVALGRFWSSRGYLNEARDRLRTLLGLPSAAERTLVRARALNMAGNHAAGQNASGLATGFYQEALTISRELGNERGIASILRNLGNLHYEEDPPTAQALHEESLEIAHKIGDQEGELASLNLLAFDAAHVGDDQEARALWEQVLVRRGRDGVGNDVIFRGLGRLAMKQGDYETARARFEESLVYCRKLGNKNAMPDSLRVFAILSAARGEAERAARLFGAAASLLNALGKPQSGLDREDTIATRETLGEEAFAAAWAEGQAMTLNAAVTYALEDPSADKGE
jgi:predicted ATPase/class 3 adenylate cyclase